MIYLYIVLSLLFVLAAKRCLRSKFNGMMPVLVLSFAFAGIVTLVVHAASFRVCASKTTTYIHKETYPVEYIDTADRKMHTPDFPIRYDKESVLADSVAVHASKSKSSYAVLSSVRVTNPVAFYKGFASFVQVRHYFDVYLKKSDYELYEATKGDGE